MTTDSRFGIGTLTLLALLTIATSALAATITVDTKHDVVADDGLCSLREAVSAANQNTASGASPGECEAGDPLPTLDEIRVPKGKFRLTLGTPGENLNAGGDLDITESVVIEGAGRRKTRIENGLGERKIPGDGDRLLETVYDGDDDDVALSLRNLGLRRGDVGCNTNGCIAGASALEIGTSGRVSLTDVEVAQNRGGCSGLGCGVPGHTAPIRRHIGLGAITLRRTLVAKNVSHCSGLDCHAGSSVLDIRPSACPVTDLLDIDQSRIERNVVTCRGDGCTAGSALHALMGRIHVLESAITKNRSDCDGAGCATEDFLHLILDHNKLLVEESQIAKNTLSCSGLDCDGGAFLHVVSRGTDVIVRDSAMERNQQRCAADMCDLGRFLHMDLLTNAATFERFAFARNVSRCIGFDCDADDLFYLLTDGAVSLLDMDFTKNLLACTGDDCDTDDLFELRTGPLTATRVAITKSAMLCTGEDCDLDKGVDWAGNPLLADRVRIERNRARAVGFDCDVDEFASMRIRTPPGTLTVLDSHITRNRMECIGDQGDVENVLSVFGSEGLISDTYITGNRSRCVGVDCTSRNGAGIENGVGDLSVVDTVLDRNETAGDGGAFYNRHAASATLLRTTVETNRAGGRGGAIFNAPGFSEHPAAVLAVLDSLIIDNEAGIDAGGIYNEGTVTSLAGTLFRGNDPPGTDCVNGPGGTGCP